MQNLLPQNCAKSPEYIDENGCIYTAGTLARQDTQRHDAYQRLRADIFVTHMHWKIPLDVYGREHDRYDQENETVTMHCVFGKETSTEHILGGVRLIAMQRWQDSMLFNEFSASHFIPADILKKLLDLDCRTFLEITRFCVQQGRWYSPPLTTQRYQTACARDLTYAGVYALASRLNRPYAVGIAHPNYLRIMRLAHFQFEEIYPTPNGSLVLIDLWRTIDSILAAKGDDRAQRMLWDVKQEALLTRTLT